MSENLKIALINGPNLNTLGKRQPEIYGTTTLKDIEFDLIEKANKLGFSLICKQSNHEGELIDFIQSLDGTCKGVIINPGALMMNGYSLLDAILGSDLPFVEVHISNVYRRESFRHKSILASACIGQITGFGIQSYDLGLTALTMHLKNTSSKN